MLRIKFGVSWPFGSEEAKNRFSRWWPWRPSWISDRNDINYFCFTSQPNAFYQVSSQLAQGCRRSRLLKQLLAPHDGLCTTDDGHWLTTIAHHEHFVLRWAKKNYNWRYSSTPLPSPPIHTHTRVVVLLTVLRRCPCCSSLFLRIVPLNVKTVINVIRPPKCYNF